MAPKVKTTREDIINAALEHVRQRGADALSVREISTALGCSTQPIFSNFSSMEELKEMVIKAAEKVYCDFYDKELSSGKYPPYKSAGMAYIIFAKEEKELFKLLYMRDRTDEAWDVHSPLYKQMAELVKGATGTDEDEAMLFHLEMWIWVHGVATMLASSYLNIDYDLISKMMTDCYQGLCSQFSKE